VNKIVIERAYVRWIYGSHGPNPAKMKWKVLVEGWPLSGLWRLPGEWDTEAVAQAVADAAIGQDLEVQYRF